MLSGDTSWLTKPLGDRLAAVRKLYDPVSDLGFAQALFSDRFMAAPTRQLAAAAAQHRQLGVDRGKALHQRGIARHRVGGS